MTKTGTHWKRSRRLLVATSLLLAACGDSGSADNWSAVYIDGQLIGDFESSDAPDGWADVDFDDSGWASAIEDRP